MTGRRRIDRWEDDNKIFLFIKERILPTIYGAIIGDLMGVPVEFKQRDTFLIKDIIGYGTYNQPPGTWSDDTSLTLCLMENIVERGNTETLMDKFVDYRDCGYKTPYGIMFDIGNATTQAISRYKAGNIPENCGGTSEYDNGNGAIMRIAPLAFLFYNDFDFFKRLNIVEQYTKITHAHPRAILGSVIYIELLLCLYYNNSINESIEGTLRIIDEKLSSNHVYREELEYYKRIFDKNFFNIPEKEIFSDGYVVHTLESAIWCIGNTKSFKEAILKAVNLGGDTDTVGTITGALAGMYYKMDGIPDEWLQKIVCKEDIDKQLNKFYKYCSEKAIISEYGSL
ncbi:MAG: ADP-ribosylglycohydrolase family protein [Clostridiales bacterium]